MSEKGNALPDISLKWKNISSNYWTSKLRELIVRYVDLLYQITKVYLSDFLIVSNMNKTSWISKLSVLIVRLNTGYQN